MGKKSHHRIFGAPLTWSEKVFPHRRLFQGLFFYGFQNSASRGFLGEKVGGRITKGTPTKVWGFGGGGGAFHFWGIFWGWWRKASPFFWRKKVGKAIFWGGGGRGEEVEWVAGGFFFAPLGFGFPQGWKFSVLQPKNRKREKILKIFKKKPPTFWNF